MKAISRTFLVYLLARLSRAILRKYQPHVIMVTGSVGKTSTKDAVIAAFSSYTDVRGSEKSFNSELGVPLTIIGAHNPWEDITKWASVFLQALGLILFLKPYPKVLVLEVGADRPGDLARILRFATPDAVVVTRLPDVPVHVEAYASTEAVKDEEFTPAFALAPGSPLILASDNAYALSMGKKTTAHMYTFGFQDGSDVVIVAPSLKVEKGVVTGMEASVVVKGASYPLIVSGALGTHHLLAPASAIACALSLGVPMSKILAGLKKYHPPAGRSRILRGIHHSTLIDDTYNSSPVAVQEALASLALMPTQGRRIAILADMLELGRYSHAEHEAIGIQAARVVDLLVCVGTRSKATAEAASGAGLTDDQIITYTDSIEAARELPIRITQEDSILIKGSQGMRMERVVEVLLEDKADTQYLVRQEKEWKKR
jgi:UDP-N-acetylmuramoyl-tripeptide--D-alanyl-D-alanine ligase